MSVKLFRIFQIKMIKQTVSVDCIARICSLPKKKKYIKKNQNKMPQGIVLKDNIRPVRPEHTSGYVGFFVRPPT